MSTSIPPSESNKRVLWLLVGLVAIGTALLTLLLTLGFDKYPLFKEWGSLLLVPVLYALFTWAVERWKFLRSTDSFLSKMDTRNMAHLAKVESAVAESVLANEPRVNKTFKEQIQLMGSMYFTGVMRQYRTMHVFGEIKKPPEDFELDPDLYGDSKLLYIGIAPHLLPSFVAEAMRDHATLTVRPRRYQILHTTSTNVTHLRFHSMLDGKFDSFSEEEYRSRNRDGLKDIREMLGLGEGLPTKGDVFQLLEHHVFPFGSMVAHGNYIWYAPLWNHKNSKTKGAALEVRRDSQFGAELIDSFDAIWDSVVPDELLADRGEEAHLK